MKTKTSDRKYPTRIGSDEAILFDLDGVLVDVSDSYRKAIQETVHFFSGIEPKPDEIQQFKQKGGYNNDWDLTQAILLNKGEVVPKVEIVEKFQELYLGINGRPGFIQNEKWLLPKSNLSKLHGKRALGIVTGRPKAETLFVLRKFEVEDLFGVVVTMEDYPPEKAKPNPYPIELALMKTGKEAVIYVGDSVDDMISAKRAGVRAIGCVPPGLPEEPLRSLLLDLGAEEVLSDIREIMFLVD